MRPATPPPDFDLDLTLTSLQRMKDAGANRLLFSHFGPVTDVDETLDRSEEELRHWVEVVDAVTPSNPPRPRHRDDPREGPANGTRVYETRPVC